MGAPLLWAGASPVLVYNLLIIAGLALSGWSMYLLMRRWTGSEWAGDHRRAALRVQRARADALRAPAGAACRVLSADALRARSRDRRPLTSLRAALTDAVLLAAAFVLQSLCSNYLLVFMTYALVVAVAVRWSELDKPQDVGSCSIAGVISVVALAPFLWPYYQVDRDSRPGPRVRRRHAVQRRLARLPRHRRPAALRVVEPSALTKAERRSSLASRRSSLRRSPSVSGRRDLRDPRAADGGWRSACSASRCRSARRCPDIASLHEHLPLLERPSQCRAMGLAAAGGDRDPRGIRRRRDREGDCGAGALVAIGRDRAARDRSKRSARRSASRASTASRTSTIASPANPTSCSRSFRSTPAPTSA